jgi:ferrous-iron efflux pump FieF
MSYYSNEKATLLKRAQYLSVSVALIICAIKIYSWISTDSVALFASLVDSVLDITSSFISMIALRIALLPPDHNHRFGHNKIEDLAVFGQSIFISISGLFALYASGRHIMFTDKIENTGSGIIAMCICCALTIFLVLYQSFVINKTHSNLIKADKLHYTSDLLTNGFVIISLYFSDSFIALDAIFGIVIASYVIYGSYGLLMKSLKNLVDEEFSDPERQKIINIISTYDEVLGIHEMKTRYAGNKPFIQFHLEMDGAMTLSAVHDISDKITLDILEEFDGAEITIHQDPAGLEPDNLYIEILRNRKR